MNIYKRDTTNYLQLLKDDKHGVADGEALFECPLTSYFTEKGMQYILVRIYSFNGP